MTYLQIGIGSIVARIVLAFVFLGIFYRLKVYTVYGFLAHRFGFPTKNTAAGAFLLGRFFAGGSRLFIASLAVKVVTGMDFTLSIVLLGLVSIFYTLFGGIKAVIWTDVIQAIILVLGAVLSVVILMGDIPLSSSEIFQVLGEHAKFRIFDVGSSGGMEFLSNPYHLLPALVGGFFLTMATHGTDQAMIQRLLTCKDSFRGKLSLVMSGFLGLGVAAIFIFIGMLLFVYVRTLPTGDSMKIVSDQLLANGHNGDLYLYYILERIPPGVAGLIIASVLASAMSSIDSELNAMSSTFVTDFFQPYFDPKASMEKLMKVAKYATLGFGLIVIFVAVLIAEFYLNNPETDLLTIALGVMTLFYGGLLGVFLVGLLTRNRGNSWTNITGMVLSLLTIAMITNKNSIIEMLGLFDPQSGGSGFWSSCYHFSLAWPWFIVVGTAVTVAVSLVGMTSLKIQKQFAVTVAEIEA
jgi:SSS family transporter